MRLGGPSRVGHDQRTAFICEAMSFIARFTRIAQATFAKRVTTAFVGLRLGMGPGIALLLLFSFFFFLVTLKDTLLFLKTRMHTQHSDAYTQYASNGSNPKFGGFEFFFPPRLLKISLLKAVGLWP